MFTLLLLGSLTVLFIAGVVFTEVENFGVATVTLIASLILTHFIPGLGLLHWIQGHVVETVLYTLAYIAGGVVWSFVKWFSYLVSFRDKFREQKVAFLKYQAFRKQEIADLKGLGPVELNLTGPIPAEMNDSFKQWLKDQHGTWATGDLRTMQNLEKPQASKNKARIVAWMALWPLSMLGTFLNDPVRRLFNFLFNYFKALYQKLVDHVLRNELELK